MLRPADATSPRSTSATTALQSAATATPLEVSTTLMRTLAPRALWRWPAHDAEREARRIPARVMHEVARYQSRGLVEVSSARIQIAIEARKVRAGHLDADSMPRREPVARRHRLQHYLIYVAWLHEHFALVAVAVAQPLDRLVEIERAPIGIHVQQLYGDVAVSAIRRHVHGEVDRPANLEPFAQRLRRVHQHVGPLLDRSLIHGAAAERV